MHNDQAVRDKVLNMHQSFLVQAPAGSGKTSLLVQRFLTALANAHQGPEEVLAITFTRKAAAEMRERILNALELAKQPAAPTNDYDLILWNLGKQVLQRDLQAGWQLLDNPTRLKIQTIDALSANIATKMPILSRYGAQPQIEQKPELLYARAVDQLLQLLDQSHSPYANHLHILLRHLDNDRTKTKNLFIRMLQNREQWLPTLAQQRGSSALRQHLEKGLIFACEEALEDLNALVPPVLDVAVLQEDEPETLTQWLAIVEKLLTAEGEWRKQVTIAQGFPAPSSAKNKEEKAQLKASKDAMHAMLEHLVPHDEFKEQLAVLRKLPPMSYTDQQWQIIDALIEILPILAAQLTLVFRDQGVVDFIAVALAAIHALQDQNAPSDLALDLDCKIRHILVDEFQDTSHIQFTLLEYLTVNWDAGDGRTLFLVGDPMQSIYRFRQADVGLFLKAKEHGIGNVQLEFAQLTTNFRSTANIMQWINNVFAASFPVADNKTLGAITYMPAQAADTTIIDYQAVECFAVNEDFESAEIVDIIQRSKRDNPQHSIAILVRAKSHLWRILPALRTAQISYQGIEIDNLSKRPLVQDLCALTRALLHLDDRIAWLACLRAPFCGLQLNDLQIIAQYDATIYAALQTKEVIDALSADAQLRAARFIAVMRDSISWLGRDSITLILKSTVSLLGAHHCIRSEDELQEFTAYFSLLETLAYKPELYNPGFIEQQLQNLFLRPTDLDPNAVQIMTMHKAKGLEFDIVILPGLTKTTRHQDQQLLLLEQRDYEHRYLLLAPIRAADQSEDTIYHYLAWCDSRREEYETLRQLYVAATRAKHKIFCLADVNDRVGGMLKKIWPQVANQFINSQQATEISVEPNTSLLRLPSAWFNQNEYEPYIIHPTPNKYKLWQQAWLNQAGTVMHRVLWRIATTGLKNLPPKFVQDLPEVCLQHLRALGVANEYHTVAIQLILDAVQNMLRDPFGAKILSAQYTESYAEWSLTHFVADKCETVRLDRVFLDQDNILWLVDYKLVQHAENIATTILENTKQIAIYVQMLENLRPNFKIVAGLYFPLQTHWHQMY